MRPVTDPPRESRRVAVAVLLAAATLLAAACGLSASPPATSRTDAASSSRPLDPHAFAAAIVEPGRFTVNVHVPFEGRLDGTDLELPFDRILADAARLPVDRGTPVAIYCMSGRMSALAAGDLARLGYREVVELSGGMEAWARQGWPLEAAEPASSSGASSASHLPAGPR